MIKIMLFIDGTWLYSNTPKLAELYGKGDFQVDFGWLPKVLAEEVNKQLGGVEVDVVRTYLFGSYASNYDLRAERLSTGIDALDEMLKDGYWAGSSTLCAGPSGIGKTLMGLHFIVAGAVGGLAATSVAHDGDVADARCFVDLQMTPPVCGWERRARTR